MPGQVDEAVQAERLERLNQLLDEQQRAFNASQVGKVLPVLFEKAGRHPGQIVGRSPYLQAVHAEGGEHLIGKIVPVHIVSGQQNSLTGKLIAPVPSSRDLGVSVLGA
jgi:tRNA-2-methylthio-N6-dimethylallyladenosine synthase